MPASEASVCAAEAEGARPASRNHRRRRVASHRLGVARAVGEGHLHLDRAALVRRGGRVGDVRFPRDVGLGRALHPHPLEAVAHREGGRRQVVGIGDVSLPRRQRLTHLRRARDLGLALGILGTRLSAAACEGGEGQDQTGRHTQRPTRKGGAPAGPAGRRRSPARAGKTPHRETPTPADAGDAVPHPAGAPAAQTSVSLPRRAAREGGLRSRRRASPRTELSAGSRLLQPTTLELRVALHRAQRDTLGQPDLPRIPSLRARPRDDATARAGARPRINPCPVSFLKTSSAAEFLAFQPTGRGDFRKRCLNFSVGHRRGTRRGRMC